MLSAALTMESGSLPIDDVKPSLLPTQTDRGRDWKSVLVMAAAIAFLAVATRWAYLELQTGDSVRRPSAGESAANGQEPTSRGIALVTRLVNAEWEDPNHAVGIGDALTPGRLKLKSGYVADRVFLVEPPSFWRARRSWPWFRQPKPDF